MQTWLCVLIYFNFSHWIHSMRFPKNLNAPRKKQPRLEKKCISKSFLILIYAKRHKYGNKTLTSTRGTDTRLAMHHHHHHTKPYSMVYKRIQWIKIEKIIINRISSVFRFHFTIQKTLEHVWRAGWVCGVLLHARDGSFGRTNTTTNTHSTQKTKRR